MDQMKMAIEFISNSPLLANALNEFNTYLTKVKANYTKAIEANELAVLK